MGSDAIPAHWVHKPCGAFQRKGGFAGAMGVEVFSGMPVNEAIWRFMIIVRASIRPGPHG
jgi:hypothetical protein